MITLRTTRARRAAPMLSMLLLCAGWAAFPAAAEEGATVVETAAGEDVTSVLDYFDRIQMLTADEIRQERARLEARVSNRAEPDGDLLRLALLQSRQGATAGETKAAAKLLRDYLDRSAPDTRLHRFAELLLLFANEREACRDHLRQARVQVRGLQRKLDALTTIETNLSHREDLQSPTAP